MLHHLYKRVFRMSASEIIPQPSQLFNSKRRLFSFGVVADIQYANKPAINGRMRYEKDAINKLKQCVQQWKNNDLKCVVNLGDIIDGHEQEPHRDKDDLKEVMNVFNLLDIPKYHVLGNHCVWNLGCNYLTKELGMCNRYYDVDINDGWRFVFLDGTDMSLMKDSHSLDEAMEYVKQNSHRMLEDWNGGISKKQINWLKSVFDDAKIRKQRVVLFCHWPLVNIWGPEMESSMLWNASDILPILDPDVVFMCMSGHMHENGHMYHNGVHHVSLSAVVSALPGDNAHAILHIHDDEVVIEGYGAVSPLSSRLKLTCDGADESRD